MRFNLNNGDKGNNLQRRDIAIIANLQRRDIAESHLGNLPR